MPEQRARTYHRGRVVNTFAEEITAMLEGELSDPRIATCHVTEVVLAPGGKTCRVFVAVTGTAEEEKETLDGLTAARGFIRTEIRYRMNVRHVPEITFAIDRSEKINSRMDELLGRMEKRRNRLAERAAGETKAGGTAGSGTAGSGTAGSERAVSETAGSATRMNETTMNETTIKERFVTSEPTLSS